MLASAKLNRAWYWKVYFLKLHICVNLRTKFQVSSIILPTLPTSKRAPKKPTQIKVKPFIELCLLNCLIVLFKTYGLEDSNWTEIWSLSKIWVSFYFHQGMNTWQKQPSRGTLRNKCSENMQQVYMRAPMSKCDFNNVACNFTEITLLHGCSPAYLLHIFRTLFPKNSSGGVLLIWLNVHTIFDLLFYRIF